MDNEKFKRTKYTCYYSYLAMSSVFSLPPMLFITFHELYGISYTLLGTLMLVNFCSQMIIDLVFTFFSKYFNIKAVIKVMPLLTTVGLAVYALIPYFFPQKAIWGLFAGTVIFSVAAGLCEVFLSPIVSAIPSEHTDKDLTILHSLYGWGVVTVVVISSVYLRIFGAANWMWLTLFWAVLPVIASVLFFISPIPDIEIGSSGNESKKSGRSKGLFLCAVCIFLGSGTENVMTGWISSYMEKSLLIPKTIGDIIGMALFAFLLATTRGVYAKFGKNIRRMLTVSMAGAAVCYIVAGCSNIVALSFAACVLTGIFTSMLWPGTLVLMEEKIPTPGIAAYALMAACGDMGASAAPQLTGVIIDKFALSETAQRLSVQYSMAPDQLGLKVGMICTAVIPVIGFIWLLVIKKSLYGKHN